MLHVLILYAASVIEHGRDYKQYLFAYNNIDNVDFEFLYKLICYIGNKLGVEFFYISLIMAYISFCIKTVIAIGFRGGMIRYALFLLSYSGTFFLLHELTQFRISIALVLIISAMFFLQKKRYVTALLLSITAVFFHGSTFIFLSIFLVLPFIERLNVKSIAIISVIFMLAMNFLSFYISDIVVSIRPSAKGYVENWNNYEVEYFNLSKFFLISIAFSFMYIMKNKFEYKIKILFLYYLAPMMLGLSVSFIPEVSIRYLDVAIMLSMYLILVVDFSFGLVRVMFFMSYIFLFMYKFLAFNFAYPLFLIH